MSTTSNTESEAPPRGRRDTLEKLKLYRLLSAIPVVVGVGLMTYMIRVESEPGAIPLLVVVLGAGWGVLTHLRVQSDYTNAHQTTQARP